MGALVGALLAPIAGCAPEADPGTAAGSVSASAATQAESAATPASGWRSVGEWSGQGSRQTGSFDISSGGLRLIWEARQPAGRGGGHLMISLHSAVSGRPLQTLVESPGAGADTVLLAANPRVAFLLIDAEQLEWRIGLDERIDRRPQGEHP